MTQNDLANLCFSCLMDGSTDPAPITLDDAAYTLRCWREQGGELAAQTKDLTPEAFMTAWNNTLDMLRGDAPQKGSRHE